MRRTLPVLLLLALLSGAQPAAALELTNRSVDLIGAIETPLVRTAVARLLELDAESQEPIFLRIDSHGGSVEAGFVLIDTIQAIRSPVYALVESKAYSMGAIITLFCAKRYMLPHATLMFHEASYGTLGEDPTIRSRIEFSTRFLDRMHRKIAERIGMREKDYRARIRDGWWLMAEDALQFGVVDEVVSSLSFREVPMERVEMKRTVTTVRKRHVDPETIDNPPSDP